MIPHNIRFFNRINPISRVNIKYYIHERILVMCTAISINNKHHYFGRTLDIECDIARDVVISPRNFVFSFRNSNTINHHAAIIGAATVSDNYPLYYEATNEHGLSIAGLNFTHSAHFNCAPGKPYNIETYELIPWILCQCSGVDNAKKILAQTNIVGNGFNPQYGTSPLHWIIADKNKSITLESTRDGIRIYDNPLCVLTNEPPFEFHLSNIKNYIYLSPRSPKNIFLNGVEFSAYSNGMGAIGLPGDMSSASRFVRATFLKCYSKHGSTVQEDINRFFHIMGCVEQIEGCVIVGNGNCEKTVYTSCCDTDKGIYYYTTYENRQIVAINMHNENLDSASLVKYHMKQEQNVYYQNNN